MFDVSGLIPEAHDIARTVAAIYWKHTQRWFVGLASFGSAVRGDVILGVSDLDFHLYLQPSIFINADGNHNILPLELGLAIYRDLAQVDPAPFRYIDGGAETNLLPEGHVGPIPGSYHMIAGVLPYAEATNTQLKVRAQHELNRLNPLPSFVSEAFFRHGTGQGDLSHTVRQLCQMVWPIVYHIATLEQDDALAVWRLQKNRVIHLFPTNEILGSRIHAFNTTMRQYYPAEGSVDTALDLIRLGVNVLQSAADWWRTTGST
ncbi:MAG TPA: hypothetical protein VK900_13385 [Anaerolineales bacterium]|nr:hypothetical protein [Anaerolineales bacterium]